jgi:membrane-associated HD superfamily phosphohydrolase
MEILNMFSDLVPNSNNGYKQQSYTDPAILQGAEFLQNEDKVNKEVGRNLDLNMVSYSHGSESEMVQSAGVLNNEDEIEGFQETMDGAGAATKYYNDLKAQYKIALDKFNAAIHEARNTEGKGIIPLTPGVNETPEQTAKRLATDKLAREDLRNRLHNLSSQMANVSAQMMSNVKDNTSKDFSSYNKMQKEIDNVQRRIIEIDAIMKKNSSRATHDIDTSLAKKHETSLLTKQRYYVYIIWFVILAIILYITISNLFDDDSSFSVLLIALLLLICLFLYFMYSQWSVGWHDLKYKLKNLDFGLPEIPKIDFNPLVSVKYTS